jgi:hypothetical protein
MQRHHLFGPEPVHFRQALGAHDGLPRRRSILNDM